METNCALLAVRPQFKLFGGMGLMLVFVIGQGLFLAKYMEPQESK
jgi:intracellular septation protein